MKIKGYLSIIVLLLSGCSVKEKVSVDSAEQVDKSTEPLIQPEEAKEEHIHDLQIQWFGEEPDCMHGGYKIVLCASCGWVDKTACGEVPALEHALKAIEIQRGNCREDTIISYICTVCGNQIKYERYTEPDEHDWVRKETELWDEEQFEFVTQSVECCERCNKVKQEGK